MSDRHARRVARMLPAMRALIPPEEMRRKQRVERALGEDGRLSEYGLGGAVGADRTAAALIASYVVPTSTRDNTDYTNTSPSVDADAVTLAVALPPGTWTLLIVGGAVCFHSATATLLVSVNVGGVAGVAHTIAGVPAGNRVQHIANRARTGIAGDATVVCTLQFHSTTAGTMTVDSSWITVLAVRTA